MTAPEVPSVPPAEAQPGQKGGELHYVVVGDSSEGGAPVVASADSLDALRNGLHSTLLEAKTGWAYIYIDGKRCTLSQPIQVFLLRLPDGKTVELRGDEPVFPDDGAFKCLESAQAH